MKRYGISTGQIQETEQATLGDFFAHGILMAGAAAVYWIGFSLSDDRDKTTAMVGMAVAIGAIVFFAIMVGSIRLHIVQQYFTFDQIKKQLEHSRDIEYIKARPVPVATEALKTEPLPELPPVQFVEYVWRKQMELGVFPTVDECQDSKIASRAMSQKFYTMMVKAEWIVDRVEGLHSGYPAPGWGYQRAVATARAKEYELSKAPYPA